jgi:hypothetical protein
MEYEADPDLVYADVDLEMARPASGVERLHDPHQHSQIRVPEI